MFWRRHVEHLRPIDDHASIQDQYDSTTVPQLELSAPSDFVPIPGMEHTESQPVSNPAMQQRPPAERCYPRRINHRPPTRYT